MTVHSFSGHKCTVHDFVMSVLILTFKIIEQLNTNKFPISTCGQPILTADYLMEEKAVSHFDYSVIKIAHD